MKKKIIKRFIAGAVCPRCALMDKIVNYCDEDAEYNTQYRECISCGFKDEIRFKHKAEELETRVNLKNAKKVPANKAEIQVLNFTPKKPD